MLKQQPGAIDTHAHLTFPDYDNDREDVLARAWEVGLEAIVVVGSGNGMDGNAPALEFTQKHENVYAMLGVHPHDAEKVDIKKAVKETKKLAANKKVVAIGEIGLDYHYKHSSVKSQIDCFRSFIELAHELKLPIAIHDREAHKDVLYTISDMNKKLTGGIFHCFSGDVWMAREVIEKGFYVSIPGIVTFKKADILRDVVRNIPIEKIVLETDCPFLAPVPYRGKRNEPAYVVHVAEEIAKLRGLSVEDVLRITTINARRALSLPGLLPEGRVAYPIRKSLYINLTNRCSLACTFCPKQSGSFEVKGHNLKLAKEPDVEDVFRAIGNCEGYEEVVFCGYGESTLRLELLKILATNIKEKGIKVRLDTDGLANLVYGHDVLPELAGLIDSVSVSMNASDEKSYKKICPSKYGEAAFFAMLSFLERAKEYIPNVTATVVGLPGLDVEACKRLAKKIGVNFRLRPYQELG